MSGHTFILNNWSYKGYIDLFLFLVCSTVKFPDVTREQKQNTNITSLLQEYCPFTYLLTLKHLSNDYLSDNIHAEPFVLL